MKVLKYVLVTILGLVVLFFAVGLIKSSVSYGAEITVNKPVKEAWAVAEDPTKYDQWLEGFQSMELIEGEYGKVGSKYRIIVKPNDGAEEFEMIETLISKEDFDHITMHFDSEFMDFEQTVNYDEKDGMTVVSTDSKVMGKGIMTRSMFAMMEGLAGAFTKQEQKNMDNLKKLIEENTKDYYPEPTADESEVSAAAEETTQ